MTLRLAALGLTLMTSRATAHELDVATAQVTLRDGHVSVTANMDFIGYVHATYDATEAPLGLVAVADPEAFATLAQTACRDLRTGVDLRMDGNSLETEDWSCPATNLLQAIAQREWMAQTVQDHIHPTLTPVTFDARLDRHQPALHPSRYTKTKTSR